MAQPYEWHDIFLSHASEDNYIARLVRGYFQQHNIQVWIDAVDAQLRGSNEDAWIARSIMPSIERCKNFIVLVSADSIQKRWVVLETEAALDLFRQEKIERLSALIIDDTKIEELPPPFNQFRALSLYNSPPDADILRDLRDEIGANNPTYINAVKPNFIKQVTLDKLTQHIGQCDPGPVKIWYVNGGRSVSSHIIPGLRRIVEMHPHASLDCSVMLTDSQYLKHPRKKITFDLSLRYWFQDRLDAYIAEAKFLDTELPHHHMVEKSLARFSDLQQGLENFRFTFKLSPLMPAGRIILIGDIAFYGPHIAEADADLPLLVFDRRSPLFAKIEKHFDDAWRPSRRWRG